MACSPRRSAPAPASTCASRRRSACRCPATATTSSSACSTARRWSPTAPPPPRPSRRRFPPGHDAAQLASSRFAGRDPARHSFPTCFVCGPERSGDGLRIFPGPVEGSQLLACTWRPGEDLAGAGSGAEVAARFVWAALDCPSGFACMPLGSMTVLASMTAELRAPVAVGDDHVVVAWELSSEGRKHQAGSAIYDAAGDCVALAEALWITLRD